MFKIQLESIIIFSKKNNWRKTTFSDKMNGSNKWNNTKQPSSFLYLFNWCLLWLTSNEKVNSVFFKKRILLCKQNKNFHYLTQLKVFNLFAVLLNDFVSCIDCLFKPTTSQSLVFWLTTKSQPSYWTLKQP